MYHCGQDNLKLPILSPVSHLLRYFNYNAEAVPTQLHTRLFVTVYAPTPTFEEYLLLNSLLTLTGVIAPAYTYVTITITSYFSISIFLIAHFTTILVPYGGGGGTVVSVQA